jgi:hypothetical protein
LKKARGFNVIATGTEMAMLTAGMRTVLDAVKQ